MIGAATIIDRSNGKADVGVERTSLVTIDVPSFAPQYCPMCAEGLDAVMADVSEIDAGEPLATLVRERYYALERGELP